MTCKNIQEMLPACQDGELSAEKEKVVRTHLESCEICRKETRLLSASWEMLGELKPIDPSPDFQVRFWSRVRRENEHKKPFLQWFIQPWLGPITAMVTVMILWVVGVSGGMLLFGHRVDRAESGSGVLVNVMASPYPANSIEQVYLQRRSNGGRRGA